MDSKTKFDIRTIPVDNLSIRSDESGGMRVSGYASLFNVPSNPMPFIEYIEPKAFDNVDLSKVLLLYNHKFENILARADSDTLAIKVDDKGLFFNANFPDTQLARDTYANIAAGNVKGCSFGFTIADGGDSWATKNGQTIHYISQFGQINEISLTPIPAYTETSVQIQRSMENYMKGRESNLDQQNKPGNGLGGLIDLAEGFAAFLKSKEGSEQPAGSNSAAASSAPASSASSPATRDDGDGGDEPDDTRSASTATSASSAATSTAPAAGSTTPAQKSSASSASSAPAKSTEPAASSAASSAATSSSATSSATSGAQQRSNELGSQTTSAAPASNQQQKGVKTNMAKTLTQDKKELQTRSFEHFLRTGQITRDDAGAALTDPTTGGFGLDKGAVIIPETILPVEHETYQFPRLGSLVRTVSVKTTTGKLPIFWNSTDKLTKHTEFTPSGRNEFPDVTPINWDLMTYTGAYVFSRDLIQDSAYNWQSDLAGRLNDLRDNTDDDLIMTALTTGITFGTSTDLIADIKTALNLTLKPQDSKSASIIVSQAAYNYLDQLKDGFGRPLIQPDVTKGTGYTLLGKTLVVIEDTLYPDAKSGDVNVTVAPLEKAVIRFKQSEITGQFQDTYDIWYQILGIYLRENVVQARKDLIINIHADPKA